MSARAKHDKAEFDAWAEYYDLIHDGLEGDVAFYVEEALRSGGEVLEIGIGTGRIALSAVLGGAHVTGVDNSPAMLALCRERAKSLRLSKNRLALVTADMRTMMLDKQFALVTMPYRTIMHLLTPDDQKQGLTNLRAHLTDGGTLIFDTWHPTPETLHRLIAGNTRKRLSLVARYTLGKGTGDLVHYARMQCDPLKQLLREEHLIQEVSTKGQVIREVRLPLVRAWTTPREMEHLIDLCGFQLRALYGGFDRKPLAPDSTEMVWVLGKKSGKTRPSKK